MIVDRKHDGSIEVSGLVDGHLKTERYYLDDGLTHAQAVRWAYKEFSDKYDLEYEQGDWVV